jgi:quinol monooxygenase YgiN
MICLAVKYKIKAGKEKSALDIFKKLAAESRKEPGCRLYVVHTNPEDGQEIYLYEQYADGTALAHHRASGHFKVLAENSLPPLFDSREVTIYHALI